MAGPGSEVGGWAETPGLASPTRLGVLQRHPSPTVGKGEPETACVVMVMWMAVCPTCWGGIFREVRKWEEPSRSSWLQETSVWGHSMTLPQSPMLSAVILVEEWALGGHPRTDLSSVKQENNLSFPCALKRANPGMIFKPHILQLSLCLSASDLPHHVFCSVSDGHIIRWVSQVAS